MSSYSRKQQNQEYVVGEEVDDGVAKSSNGGGVGDVALGLSVDNLHREFLISIDLNHPMPDSTLIELDEHTHLPFDFVFEKKTKTKDIKKRCLKVMEASDGEKISNLDLNLRLSPPGLNLKYGASNRSSFSSLASQSSCMSMIVNLNEPPCNIPEVPSLILMGCTKCLIYVMVSEIDPKCPKCKGDVLLDIFRESPAKKTKAG